MARQQVGNTPYFDFDLQRALADWDAQRNIIDQGYTTTGSGENVSVQWDPHDRQNFTWQDPDTGRKYVLGGSDAGYNVRGDFDVGPNGMVSANSYDPSGKYQQTTSWNRGKSGDDLLGAGLVMFGGPLIGAGLAGLAGGAGAGAAAGAAEAGTAAGTAGGLAGGAAPSVTGLAGSGMIPAGMGYGSGMTTGLAGYGGLGAGAGYGATLAGSEAALAAAGSSGYLTGSAIGDWAAKKAAGMAVNKLAGGSGGPAGASGGGGQGGGGYGGGSGLGGGFQPLQSAALQQTRDWLDTTYPEKQRRRGLAGGV